ncbi:alpha/beta fold hydrolase [Nocardia sp. NEAU-G5]|uniref:Alpha/beta fold hydrolase n=1 Tax=Nocardia albiluteola TaxID=2842303 RepID=A0ABS6BB45_9NOCA|nr:alpha/beta hydrolase [Nocardia albiluteola]MBU3067507.1 alpha/beta fold hydrolase [Nocardia albiluteola]
MDRDCPYRFRGRVTPNPIRSVCHSRSASWPQPTDAGWLVVERRGTAGPRVILVHGMRAARASWAAQLPLAQRMRLDILHRGVRDGALFPGGDYLHDAGDLLSLLESEPAHLVGHGYGAVGCLVAAAAMPDRVASLTLIEPTCLGVLSHPAVVSMRQRWRWDRPVDLLEFAGVYGRLAGLPADTEFTTEQWRAIARLRTCRPPWDTRLPLETIAQQSIPSLVCSGDHSPVLTAVAATVAEHIGGEHAVLPGAQHAVQSLGAPFNDLLERHILRATQD